MHKESYISYTDPSVLQWLLCCILFCTSYVPEQCKMKRYVVQFFPLSCTFCVPGYFHLSPFLPCGGWFMEPDLVLQQLDSQSPLLDGHLPAIARMYLKISSGSDGGNCPYMGFSCRFLSWEVVFSRSAYSCSLSLLSYFCNVIHCPLPNSQSFSIHFPCMKVKKAIWYFNSFSTY